MRLRSSSWERKRRFERSRSCSDWSRTSAFRSLQFPGPKANFGFKPIRKRAEPLLTFSQRLLSPFLLSNVPRDFRGSDHSAFAISHR